jgi:hypothetical protein
MWLRFIKIKKDKGVSGGHGQAQSVPLGVNPIQEIANLF